MKEREEERGKEVEAGGEEREGENSTSRLSSERDTLGTV